MPMLLSPRGGPFRLPDQAPGEIPSKIPDIAISMALMPVFMCMGASHLYLLVTNKKRGKKFLPNGMCFGLCDVRVITFSLRTAWALHPTNVRLGMASTIFVYAGTVLLFIGNLLFTQRIVRAQHPSFGWTKPVAIAFPALVIVILLSLVMIVVVVIQQFYTLDTNIRRIDRDVQLAAQIVYVTMAFLPIPIVLASTSAGQWASIKARRKLIPVDKFGRGRMLHKVVLVVMSSALLSLEAGFRCGTAWKTPVLSRTPDGQLVPQPWYFTKAAFYCFNFIPEILVVSGWLLARIDHMFHVPNGATGGYQESQARNEKAVDDARSEVSVAWSETGSAVPVLYAFGPTDKSSAVTMDYDFPFRTVD